MASADFRQICAVTLNLLTAKILLLSKKIATEFAHERGDPEWHHKSGIELMAAKRKETPAPLKPGLMLSIRLSADQQRWTKCDSTELPVVRTQRPLPGVLLRVLIVASSAQTTGD